MPRTSSLRTYVQNNQEALSLLTMSLVVVSIIILCVRHRESRVSATSGVLKPATIVPASSSKKKMATEPLVLQKFQSLSHHATGKLHERMIAARALPLLMSEGGFRSVRIALDHASRNDGAGTLPLVLQKYIHEAREYIEHTQATVLQDLCDAVHNDQPPLPRQYERLKNALGRAGDVGFVATPTGATAEGNDIHELMVSATHMLDRLKDVWSARKMIEMMDPRTVAEMKSFLRPSPDMEAVVRTTLVLLDTPGGGWNRWEECLDFVSRGGRESVQYRVGEFAVQMVTAKQLHFAEHALHTVDIEELSNTSSCAVKLYRWCHAIVAVLIEERHPGHGALRRAKMAAHKVFGVVAEDEATSEPFAVDISVHTLFHLIDKNKDGLITKREMIHAATMNEQAMEIMRRNDHLVHLLEPKHFLRLFQSLDAGHTGKITLSEFARFVESAEGEQRGGGKRGKASSGDKGERRAGVGGVYAFVRANGGGGMELHGIIPGDERGV